MIPLWLFIPSIVVMSFVLLLCVFKKKDQAKIIKLKTDVQDTNQSLSMGLRDKKETN
jgi:hypothetical protein